MTVTALPPDTEAAAATMPQPAAQGAGSCLTYADQSSAEQQQQQQVRMNTQLQQLLNVNKRCRSGGRSTELEGAEDGLTAADTLPSKRSSSSSAGAAAAAEHMQEPAVLPLREDMVLPVAARLPPRPCEPLSEAARQALSRQDVLTRDQWERVLRFEDQIAELASCRGLLVRFIVRAVKTYQAQPDIMIEAPEFMTVEYLKRRIVRAKLQRGEFVSPTRFLLRRRLVSPDGSVLGGMEELPTSRPTGDEVFLAHLGYEAPGPYELFLAAAPPTSDQQLQQRLLSGLVPQPAPFAEAAAAAAAAAAAPEVTEARASYQALLQKPGPRAAQPTRAAGPQPVLCTPGSIKGPCAAQGAQQRVAGLPVPQASSDAQLDKLYQYEQQQQQQQQQQQSMRSIAPAGMVASVEHRHSKPRRQTGRWATDEVQALIEGVTAFGSSWSQIHQRYVLTGRINPERTQGDLKDKWRNLGRLVAEPYKATRGPEVTEEQRQQVQQLLLLQGQLPCSPAPSAAAATP